MKSVVCAACEFLRISPARELRRGRPGSSGIPKREGPLPPRRATPSSSSSGPPILESPPPRASPLTKWDDECLVFHRTLWQTSVQYNHSSWRPTYFDFEMFMCTFPCIESCYKKVSDCWHQLAGVEVLSLQFEPGMISASFEEI
jgi:hypothetical protein